MKQTTKGANGTPKKRESAKRSGRARSKKRSPAVRRPSTSLDHSDAAKARALTAYRYSGAVAYACKRAKVGRRTWYNWMESDPAFANAALEAAEDVTDELEREAIKRAKAGSDTLIIFLLKSKRPERYRETQKIEVTHPAVRENLSRTIEIITEELSPADADRVLVRLDAVWQ